jgi:hypothetical protein
MERTIEARRLSERAITAAGKNAGPWSLRASILASLRMTNVKWILCSLLLLGLLVCPLSRATAGEEDEMWGRSGAKPVPDGAKVTLETDRQEFFLGENILNFPEPIPELLRAMQSLHARGFTLDSGGLSGNAQIMLWFVWLQNEPGPRPARWMGLVEAFGSGSHYPLNEAVVRSIPSPMPPQCAKFVQGALANRDYGVCRAACEAAGKSGKKEFITPLLEIIETEPHDWLLRAASDAARQLGAGYELLEVWADRLNDETLHQIALDNLQTVFEGLPGMSGGRTDISRGERLELRTQWKAFLAEHAADLRAGKKLKLRDPAVSPALFGRARSFHFPDGTDWP